jgi:Disulphide bond corrector protein DsbC
MRMKRWLLFWVLAIAVAQAQEFSPGKGAGPSVSLVSAPIPTVVRGESGSIDLRFHVASGYHINSNKPSEEFMIPTALHVDATTDVVVGKISYPPGQDVSFEFAPDQKLSVYSGNFTLGVLVRPLHTVPPGKYAMRGFLKYQACDDRACYPPKQLPVVFEVRVAKVPVAKARRSAQSPHVHK